jgi:hypothetical protein
MADNSFRGLSVPTSAAYGQMMPPGNQAATSTLFAIQPDNPMNLNCQTMVHVTGLHPMPQPSYYRPLNDVTLDKLDILSILVTLGSLDIILKCRKLTVCAETLMGGQYGANNRHAGDVTACRARSY